MTQTTIPLEIQAYAKDLEAKEDDVRLRTWAKERGLVRSTGRPCLQRLVRASHRCKHGVSLDPCFPEGLGFLQDSALWLEDGKLRAVTALIARLKQTTIHRLDAFCEAHGLECRIEGWHGERLLIVIWRY